MKLNQQVCSLELAQKLKTLGVKQESLFWWIAPEASEKWPPKLVYKTGLGAYYENGAGLNEQTFEVAPILVSAFTVAELGEMLPVRIDAKGKNDARQRLAYYLDYQAGGFSVCYSHHLDIRQVLAEVSSDTEADARAKMLVYLLENELIKLV